MVIKTQSDIKTSARPSKVIMNLIVERATLTRADGAIIELLEEDEWFIAQIRYAASHLGMRLKVSGQFSGCCAER